MHCGNISRRKVACRQGHADIGVLEACREISRCVSGDAHGHVDAAKGTRKHTCLRPAGASQGIRGHVGRTYIGVHHGMINAMGRGIWRHIKAYGSICAGGIWRHMKICRSILAGA